MNLVTYRNTKQCQNTECNLIPSPYRNIHTVTDKFAKEFQFDGKELVKNQGPLEALHLEQKSHLLRHIKSEGQAGTRETHL